LSESQPCERNERNDIGNDALGHMKFHLFFGDPAAGYLNTAALGPTSVVRAPWALRFELPRR
jgi:hypothetical protein